MAWIERSRGSVTTWRVVCHCDGWLQSEGPKPSSNLEAAADTICRRCGSTKRMLSETGEQFDKIMVCGQCESEECEERYSFAIYAGVYCDGCWKKAGYRDDLNIVGGPTDDEIEASDYRDED